MGRSVFDVPTPYSPEQVNDILNQFTSMKKFRLVNYKGDQVLKKGDGFFTAAMYLKVLTSPGMVHIEAWIRAMGEQGLDGFVGAIPKQMLRTAVNDLTAMLSPPVAPVVPPPQQ